MKLQDFLRGQSHGQDKLISEPPPLKRGNAMSGSDEITGEPKRCICAHMGSPWHWRDYSEFICELPEDHPGPHRQTVEWENIPTPRVKIENDLTYDQIRRMMGAS